MRRGKALAGIVGQVTVTDTNGATVDTSEFFGDDNDEAAADDATSDDA